MGDMIRLTAGDDHQLDAYRADPASAGDGVIKGGLVVVQEIFGVNGHIRAAHPDIPVHVYSAGHGFNCGRRAEYHRQSAEMALSRTLAFFSEHLIA